jgi:CO/xanthine dehydrogenase FAD-binding subunit
MPAWREVHRPRDLGEALQLLQRPDVVSVPLGGGATLIGAAAAGRPAGWAPAGEMAIDAVVDLSALGLDTITVEPPEPDATGGPFPLRLGAQVTLQALADHPEAAALAGGLLATAARRAASRTLREQFTLGGTLVAGEPEHPLRVALLALDAEAIVWTARAGGTGSEPRAVAVDSLYDYGDQLRRRRALITEVRVARSLAPTGGALGWVARTPADVPIVCAAARVYRNRQTGRAYGVRLALGGLAGRPLRLAAVEDALEAQQISPERLDAVEALVAEALGAAGVAVTDGWRASAEYRRAIAGVLARRALATAWERAGDGLAPEEHAGDGLGGDGRAGEQRG